MKTIPYTFIYCIVAFALISCNSRNVDIESYEGFPLEVTSDYKKVWAEEFSNDLGTFYVYELKKPKVIQSYPVKGRFYVNSEGKLHSFTFAEDHVFNGTLITKGSWYEQDIEEGDGYAIKLSKDITIQNFPVYHKQRLFSENFVSFHKDGTLLGFSLANDMHVDNIPCNGTGKNRRVMLYHNQNLRFCYLSENLKIHEIPCEGGEKNNNLWLYQDGNILSCILSTDIELSGKMYTKGTTMIFDKKGKVHYLTGQVNEVNFYENGQVQRCFLANDLEINGKLVQAGSKIVFNKTGEIKYIKE